VDVNTVGELIDWLAGQPRGRIVVMSSDAEGNSFSPLADAGESLYVAESTWAGDIYPTPEDIADDDQYTDEDDGAPDEAVRVVLLWPTN